jgi:hypothetical protein
MSLTSQLKSNEKLKKALKEHIKKPKVKLDACIVAQPLTENYSIIGTAFDYLFRFYLSANYNAKDEEWFAEYTIKHRNVGKLLRDWVEEARNNFRQYLSSKVITEQLLISCLKLAKIDPIGRALVFPLSLNINKNDVDDLRNLADTLSSFYSFSGLSMKDIVLNPSFGESSKIVGGADADFIIDKTLIDIKTTKNLLFSTSMIYQIVCYWILNQNEKHCGRQYYEIDNVGIYFSRHKLIIKFNIADIIDHQGINDISMILLGAKIFEKEKVISQVQGKDEHEEKQPQQGVGTVINTPSFLQISDVKFTKQKIQNFYLNISIDLDATDVIQSLNELIGVDFYSVSSVVSNKGFQSVELECKTRHTVNIEMTSALSILTITNNFIKDCSNRKINMNDIGWKVNHKEDDVAIFIGKQMEKVRYADKDEKLSKLIESLSIFFSFKESNNIENLKLALKDYRTSAVISRVVQLKLFTLDDEYKDELKKPHIDKKTGGILLTSLISEFKANGAYVLLSNSSQFELLSFLRSEYLAKPINNTY